MEIIVAGSLSIALCLIFKMVRESKTQIDALIQELEDIQEKIEISLHEKETQRDKHIIHHLQNTILANGKTENTVSNSPFTPADHN